MTDWRSAIRNIGERDAQDELSTEEALAMRHVVVAAAATQGGSRAHSSWVRPIVVMATVVAGIALAVVAGLRFDVSMGSDQPLRDARSLARSDAANVAADAPEGGAPNRQLQFLTPGGTRIIWVFNSDLDLKATLR